MTQDTQELVRRFYGEVMGDGNIAALDQLATDDYEEHDPFPGQGEGLSGLKTRTAMIRDGLAPHFEVEDVVHEGDKLVVRWINSGTHVGEFAGIPPTNKTFSIAGVDIFRLRDGKLAEHWHVVDQLSMLQQLGLIPSPEGADA